MTRSCISAAIGGSLLAMTLEAQQPACPAGQLAPEYGYEFISCADCLGVRQIRGRSYTVFSAEPVLHKIRPDGPGANKLQDQDTLVAVGGHPVTTDEAAILLATWRPEPVRLTVRRGTVRNALVTPAPLCGPSREFRSRNAVPVGGHLGVAIGCAGCRIVVLPSRKERWVYREPPVLVSIEQDGPADRAGLRQGDTLTRIDGFPIISAEAGDRIGDVQPGRAMTWTVRRNGELRSVTIVPEPERPRRVSRPRRSEWTVGGVKVEAVGRDVSVTRGAGGALTIRGDSITVIVRPPNGP